MATSGTRYAQAVPVALAVLSAISWGTSDFIGGLAARDIDPRLVVVWSQVVGLAVGIMAAPALGGEPSTSDMVWGAVAGAGGGLGLLALYTGLSTGKISVVAPISGVMAAGAPLIFGIIIGEQPSPTAMVGMVVAMAAIWLVSVGEEVAASGLGLALMAGAGFAFFSIAIGQSGDHAGMWPLIPARGASIVVIGTITLVHSRSLRISRTGRGKVGAAGAGDMVANMFFLAAAQTGLLSIAAVVSSLFPAQTVLLGRIVLNERVDARRWMGLALALVSVGLISA